MRCTKHLRSRRRGGCVIVVFTDEKYIHENHSPLMTWIKSGDRSVEKATSKGKRLIVLHAITTEDFTTMNDENQTLGRGTPKNGRLVYSGAGGA